MTVGGNTLFTSSPVNPILTAADLPYPANSAFNPGAARVGDETVLLVRVEDLRGISSLHVARSADGIGGSRFDPEPLLQPDPEERFATAAQLFDLRLQERAAPHEIGEHAFARRLRLLEHVATLPAR